MNVKFLKGYNDIIFIRWLFIYTKLTVNTVAIEQYLNNIPFCVATTRRKPDVVTIQNVHSLKMEQMFIEISIHCKYQIMIK